MRTHRTDRNQRRFTRIAESLDKGHLVSSDAEEVFAELCRASAGGIADYGGFSYERLRSGEELFWPCPSPSHPGTPRLFVDGFPTADGKARFFAVDALDSVEQLDEAYPYYLTTGRLLGQYQTGAQTRRVASLNEAEPEPFAALHPELARASGVKEGDWVRLRSRRGELVLPVRLTEHTRVDVIFVPFHWGDTAKANLLTSRLLDPESKIPEFKLAAVALDCISVRTATH